MMYYKINKLISVYKECVQPNVMSELHPTQTKYVWFWMQCECHSPRKLGTKWSNLYDHPI